MNIPLRIAIDVMGGDYAPLHEIQGALMAYKAFNNSNTPVEFIFVGREAVIRDILNKQNLDIGFRYSIVSAEEVITMEDEAAISIRTKKNSSLICGIQLHKSGGADAFISAGNTGAVMTAATLILGRIKGVSRPVIGSFFPTMKDQPTLVLDVGANAECKPKFLYEFAIMGSIYLREITGLKSPKIGLLNVGEERTKGNTLALDAYHLLEQNPKLNFIGNVEGRDILAGSSDVVICDGFTGNIVLKFAESIITMLKSKIQSHAGKSILNKIAVAVMVPTLRKILKEFDYQEYGGVPLLGVNGVVIIGHGKSSPLAIKNMLIRAVEIVEKQINIRIEEELQTSTIE